MPDHWYLRMGRIVTVCGVLVAIGTAFIASGYTNIMDYIQLLFSFFNAPLFATFIIALFWKRATPVGGDLGPRGRHARRGGRPLPQRVGGHRPRHAAGGGLLGRRRGVHGRRRGHRRGLPRHAARSRWRSCAASCGPRRPTSCAARAAGKEDHGWYRSPAVLGGGVHRGHRDPQLRVRLGRKTHGECRHHAGAPRTRAIRDEFIREAEESESGAVRNLFDLRMIIGGLFVVYGVYLTHPRAVRLERRHRTGGRPAHQPVDGPLRAGAWACASSPGRCCGRCASRRSPRPAWPRTTDDEPGEEPEGAPRRARRPQH